MRSNLYINDVKITKEIPEDNYLSKLPVVRNLMKAGGLHFDKKVTFLVGENGVDKSLHKQSHSESFLALVENRFGGNGLYILDEPEAALSPMRLMRLMVCMQDLVNRNSQFIIPPIPQC